MNPSRSRRSLATVPVLLGGEGDLSGSSAAADEGSALAASGYSNKNATPDTAFEASFSYTSTASLTGKTPDVRGSRSREPLAIRSIKQARFRRSVQRT